MKRVVASPAADQEIDAAIIYYARENKEVAGDFLIEIEQARDRMGAFPEMGSPRLAQRLNIDGLRAYFLRGFPYVLFYIEREDHVDLLRVLHTHRDIFKLLLDTD